MKQRKIYHYNPKLKERARQLRNNSTLSEVLLWNELKNEKMKGKDFHRQKPIMDYIVDFFCLELALAIEIDGNSHNRENAYEKDIERQREIERLGIQFLRFNDLDVKRNMPGVLSVIEQWIEGHTPDPSQEGNYPPRQALSDTHRRSAPPLSQGTVKLGRKKERRAGGLQ